MIGVLWLPPVSKGCSASLDTPVTFCAWSLSPFWQYYHSKLNALIKINSLVCLSCFPLCFLSEVLSTWASSVTCCVRKSWYRAPLLQNWWNGSLFSLVLFLSFIMTGQYVFKTDLEIVSANKVKCKQILIKMEESCFHWESQKGFFFQDKQCMIWLRELLNI